MSAPRRNRHPHGDTSSHGFTLIEIIIAIVVFGVGVLALAAVMPLGVNRNNKSGIQSRASELAASRAERFMSTPYGEDDLTAGTHDDSANPYDQQYHVRWTVEDDQPIKSCKRITIVVNRPTLTSPSAATTVIVISEAGN